MNFNGLLNQLNQSSNTCICNTSFELERVQKKLRLSELRNNELDAENQTLLLELEKRDMVLQKIQESLDSMVELNRISVD